MQKKMVIWLLLNGNWNGMVREYLYEIVVL